MNNDRADRLFVYRRFLTSDNGLLVYLSLIKLTLHLVVNAMGGYGYFRDEFYYIACSDHMAWGYVDQPPFSIAVLWLSRLLFGDSLFALRLLPAIAGAAVVIVAGLIARALGGGRFSQILAACSVIVAPILLWANSVYSMNFFDVFFWTTAFYLLVLVVKHDDPKYWVLLGIVLGLGLLNKISVLWLGAGLAVGFLLTPNRKLLLAWKVWCAAGIALLLFLPYIVWQMVHGFPTVEFIRNATSEKYVALSPLELFLQQIVTMHPLTFPIWLAGLLYLLLSKTVRQFRILAIIYLTVFLILVMNKNSKAEYLAPAIPMLFAAGALAVERFFGALRWRWPRPASITLLLLGGALTAPFVVPVLPVETYISYAQSMGRGPSTAEKKELGKLPQHYADMFGWEAMVGAVARAYHSLGPEEKAKCALLMNNYGEAGAMDFYGSSYGLPKAISGHNNYWLWGPRGATGEIVIRLGGSVDAIRASYKEASQVGVFNHEYCMPYENNLPVYVCKGRRASLTSDWAEFKHFE